MPEEETCLEKARLLALQHFSSEELLERLPELSQQLCNSFPGGSKAPFWDPCGSITASIWQELAAGNAECKQAGKGENTPCSSAPLSESSLSAEQSYSSVHFPTLQEEAHINKQQVHNLALYWARSSDRKAIRSRLQPPRSQTLHFAHFNLCTAELKMSIIGDIKPRLLKLGVQFKHDLHTYTWCVLKEVLFTFWASTALNSDPFWLHVQPLHL